MIFRKLYKSNLDLNIIFAKKILMHNIGFMRYYEKLIKYEIKKNNGYVVELGCGSQNHVEISDEIKNIIIGVDISLDKLNANPYRHKIACDVHYMPIKSITIDTIISQDLFEHIPNPSLMISDMHRVLKPGGKVIFKIPNKHSVFGLFTRFTPYRYHKIYWKITLSEYPDVTPTFYNFNDKKTIERLSKENGFNIENLEYYCSFPPAPSILPFFIYIPYIMILKIINTSKLLKQYSDVIVCCIKKESVQRI